MADMAVLEKFKPAFTSDMLAFYAVMLISPLLGWLFGSALAGVIGGAVVVVLALVFRWLGRGNV